uniref:Uncharacterized protein n=1 Tax=Vespula pensylvanica TaxID=30213 RepID=A0A834UBE9_VESPE|nr:hypothetical protein H0235_005564 [Vespula pensylvanica]
MQNTKDMSIATQWRKPLATLSVRMTLCLLARLPACPFVTQNRNDKEMHYSLRMKDSRLTSDFHGKPQQIQELTWQDIPS